MAERTAPAVIESNQAGNFELTEEVVAKYSLDRWAAEFSLMTAGFRALLDPKDAASAEVPFNVVIVAILAEAKARVFQRKLAPGEQGHVQIGGETRPHTQTFIRLAARVYAAHGCQVHLRRGVQTTPIWYSSFGVFYEEFQSGDNFTASHSQYFKGGWKPLDGSGQQLLAEEADIVAEVRAIVAGRQTIRLDAWPSALIAADFDIDGPYLEFLRTLVNDDLVRGLVEAGRRGFRVSICTMGGSMKPTSERIFAALGIPTGPGSVVNYFLSDEDSRYHGIGTVNGVDIGVDPGKREIYRKLVAEAGLLEGKTDLVLLWDPDGDRLNVATRAPAAFREAAAAAGLGVDQRSLGDQCIVYFSPNQLYLLLAALRVQTMREAGRLHDRDWFVGLTYPTTRSLEELARAEGLNCVRVPVGFKYLGSLCAEIERQLGRGEVLFETTIGQRVALGQNPRALILCEESGGGTLGGADLLTSRTGRHGMLALREKDAMQLGLLALCLGARLHTAGTSFAEHYCSLVAGKGLRCIHYSRADVLLYDEALTGAALRAAKEEGVKKRDRVMDFFGNLADEAKAGRRSLAEVRQAIVDRAPQYAEHLPPLTRACRAGDDLLHGMIFDAENLRFLVRASGTDALLRYYVESVNAASMTAIQKMLRNLDI